MASKSFLDLVLKSKGALVAGGGASDFVNGLPIISYLKKLGVEKVYLGNLACHWWEKKGQITLSPELFSIDCVENAERIADTVALVNKDSKVKTKIYEGRLPEAKVSEIIGEPVVLLSASKGVKGLVDGLNTFFEKYGIDLFINVDCGADSLYDGETGEAITPLHDFIMLATSVQVKADSVLALTGYAVDGELALEEVDKLVGRLIAERGFIGAIGITPEDADLLGKVYSKAYDPIDALVLEAAKGNVGIHRALKFRIIKVTPLAAVILFFDPKVVMKHSPAKVLKETTSLKMAEEKLLEAGVYPETRYVTHVPLYKEAEEE